MSAGSGDTAASLRTLPDDHVRAILWRFAHRHDLQTLAQSARSVARGPVARLVAQGGWHSHEWTPGKADILKALDQAGLNAAGVDLEYGGSIEGPKNLALALVAFELAWVDAGSAASNLANHLALAPIQLYGTPEQRAVYLRAACTPQEHTGEPWRGAFVLAEPVQTQGAEASLPGGKVRVAEWEEGREPMLQIDTRGRFITGAGVADFVTAVVEAADDRIEGNCLVIIEQTDPGVFDRGEPARIPGHQLSSTRDAMFGVRIPASRIVGGYTIYEGRIVPNFSYDEVVDAVWQRTGVTLGLMTAARLLSAVEPVVRYQRGRLRGAGAISPGSPRQEPGVRPYDARLHRLVDVWATGEAAASLGFEAARLFDALEPLERRKDAQFAEQGIGRGRARASALMKARKDALEFLAESAKPGSRKNQERCAALQRDWLVQFVLLDSMASVVGRAVQLWNTGHGADVMREAVRLMGGHGITEGGPSVPGCTWVDAQLEAADEGPEAAQRRQLSDTMVDEVFLAQYRMWVTDMRAVASTRPGTGACTLATAMQMWIWTLMYLQRATDANGRKLLDPVRQGVSFPMADALCWLVAARQQVLDVLQLEAQGGSNPAVAGQLPTLVPFLTDLCHVQTARAAGEVGRICAELIFGYRRHPAWDKQDCASCYVADELEAIDDLIPGMAATARFYSDVLDVDGGHAEKAGPCARIDGLEPFLRMRSKLDGCLTGSWLAKDRAADALTRVVIPDESGDPI